MCYAGKAKSRSELALEYGVSRPTFNRWLKELGIQLKTRKILRPSEINLLISEWGDFRDSQNRPCQLGETG